MTKQSTVPLLQVKQWLSTWNKNRWATEDGLPEPPHDFYLGTLPIHVLRRLAGVNPRDLERRKRQLPLPGYQRGHQKERSEAILRYINYGYPLSTQKGLSPEDHVDLVNPGWLPTAILVNIIPREEKRYRGNRELTINKDHAVSIKQENGHYVLNYPTSADSESKWDFSDKNLEPLEIIDGQHRLFAVDPGESLHGDYNVPVVFFDGLPPAWQAYLFWVINVEPKKINTSLAFDLYPELRNQRWLERGEWIKVYQEHRAQELTEVLWRHPKSPWQDRIELHGRRIEGHVSNAAFIRSLMASFVRKWGTAEDSQDLSRIGGLFGSIDRDGKSYVVPWKRPQQAAFLIRIWASVLTAVEKSKSAWVRACLDAGLGGIKEPLSVQNPHKLHSAFAGPYTLLATDQGVRAISVICNAICQVQHDRLGLADWNVTSLTETDNETVSEMLNELEQRKKIMNFIDKLASSLIDGGQDWRTSAEPSIANSEKQKIQGSYRGSSGYTLLQKDAMRTLLKSKFEDISSAASEAVDKLGWNIP